MPSREAETLRNVQRTLSALSLPIGEAVDAPSQRSAAPTSDTPDCLTIARAWAHAREALDRAFGDALFVDPAWNMLLDLYIKQSEHYDVSVSSLCIAAKVPPTTALRCISLLEDHGLLVRDADPFDKRRTFLRLPKAAVIKIETALMGATESDARLGLERLRRVK